MQEEDHIALIQHAFLSPFKRPSNVSTNKEQPATDKTTSLGDDTEPYELLDMEPNKSADESTNLTSSMVQSLQQSGFSPVSDGDFSANYSSECVSDSD